MSEGAKLNEYDKDEWFDVCRALVPGLSEDDYEQKWQSFLSAKREHETAMSSENQEVVEWATEASVVVMTGGTSLAVSYGDMLLVEWDNSGKMHVLEYLGNKASVH